MNHHGVLTEWESWRREVGAEYVTHSNETIQQVINRLERDERPESPYKRLLRERRDNT